MDRKRIEHILDYLERQLSLLENTEQWETPVQKAALERICHMIIESVLDVGNALIDGFIMRDPGSYEDIIDILEDENVISKEMRDGLKGIIACRKNLVQDYIQVDHSYILKIFSEHLGGLKQFAPRVRQYIIDELGPVTAFKN